MLQAHLSPHDLFMRPECPSRRDTLSNDSNLCQFHQVVVMPALFAVCIEIQCARVVAFLSDPRQMVIGIIGIVIIAYGDEIFVICEIFLVQVTILYPIVVFLVFGRIIQNSSQNTSLSSDLYLS